MKLHCADCGWFETKPSELAWTLPCEKCGTHNGYNCPTCNEIIDEAYSELVHDNL